MTTTGRDNHPLCANCGEQYHKHGKGSLACPGPEMGNVYRGEVPLASKEQFSPALAARYWAQRRGRADDAMLIEAWLQGWNARCIPEEPGALADHLSSMLIDGTTQCPLCGNTGPHEHSPHEIVIYRNGVKYGRSLAGSAVETTTPRYLRPSMGTGSMFSTEYKMAVSNDWCRGWNALLSALEAAGCEADPNSPWPPLVTCPDCNGTGEVCVGHSGRDDDGNAPLLEPCDTCDRYGRIAPDRAELKTSGEQQ